MEKTIRESSVYLTSLLPTDRDYYTAEDLLRAGLPDFMVRRIMMEASDRLANALVLPANEWFDPDRSAVNMAWGEFKDAIRGEAHLPRVHAAEIIDLAVVETVALMVYPRRRIVEWLFGPAQEASLGVVRVRSHYVTLHRHISEALIRYMERKEMASITRPAAIEVVKSVDERYVAGFTPLNWAQLLDPLFQLAQNRVESDLIHDFFTDKGREDLAALFSEGSSRMERVELIERLTLGRPVPKREQPVGVALPRVDEELPALPAVNPAESAPEPLPAAQPAPEKPVLRQLNLLEAEPAEDHPVPVNVPIWQRFLNDVPDEVPQQGDVDTADEPMVPLVQQLSSWQELPQDNPTASQVQRRKARLVDWLKPDEDVYIQRLFDGNEMSYYRILSQMESCADWWEAQGVLKGWVKTAGIGLDDADLAHMVDQLQNYFST